tara:strand:+ start:315 stop:1262 length:948 start_codon:yes stop_codon:yes gene_type:complete
MKNKFFIRLFYSIGCFFLSSILHGQDFARFPGSFMRMGTTARAVSLGSALTADSHHGLTGVYNPAGTAFLEQRHGTAGHQILSLDRQLSCVGITMKLPPTAGIGIAWIHAGVNHIEERNSLGEYSGKLSTGENAFVVSFAQNFSGRFALGLNAKMMTHTLPIYDEKLMGTAVGVDLGFLYKVNDFVHLGGVVQNLNAKYQWKTNAIFEETGTIYYEDFPVIYKAGFKTRFVNFQVLCDVEFVTNNSLLLGKRLNGGIEFYLNENVTFRYGKREEQFGIGFGYTYFDLDNYGVTLDYSAVMDEVGVIHVISSSFSF